MWFPSSPMCKIECETDCHILFPSGLCCSRLIFWEIYFKRCCGVTLSSGKELLGLTGYLCLGNSRRDISLP